MFQKWERERKQENYKQRLSYKYPKSTTFIFVKTYTNEPTIVEIESHFSDRLEYIDSLIVPLTSEQKTRRLNLSKKSVKLKLFRCVIEFSFLYIPKFLEVLLLLLSASVLYISLERINSASIDLSRWIMAYFT